MAAQVGFTADIEADDGRAVLRLAGELDLSQVDTAESGLRRSLEQRPSDGVVIDLRELTFIDSTGIAFLVRALQEHGSDLSFRESESPDVRRVLGIVGLDGHLGRRTDD
jgi:anti-anti-sigma factor